MSSNIVYNSASNKCDAKLFNGLPQASSIEAGIRGNVKAPFLIGVAGGTASGKSTVCRKIMEKLGQDSVEHHNQRVVCVSQDSFYRELTNDEKQAAKRGCYNFDHPDAMENELMLNTLYDILDGQVVKLPIYDFKENSRKTDEFKTIYPADVVLFEGILVFYYPEIRDQFDMKLFVDTDPDTRLARRVLRDVQEHGRDLDYVLSQYTKYVKPAFEEFCLPTKKYADVIIPRGADNEVAIDLLGKNIGSYLKLCSKDKVTNGFLADPDTFNSINRQINEEGLVINQSCDGDDEYTIERRRSSASDDSSLVASR